MPWRRNRAPPQRAVTSLAQSGRQLLALAFAFAVLSKAVLSPDYRDGRFSKPPSRCSAGADPSGALLAARHIAVLLFCVGTYAFARVAGFGWLLLVLGLANTTAGQRRLRVAYVSTFYVVLLHAEIPWA